MVILILSSCYAGSAKNAGETIYEQLGILLENHQINFEEIDISDSNQFIVDMIPLTVHYPEELKEVNLFIPNDIKRISISLHQWESATNGDFTWHVLGEGFSFKRNFEKIPYDAYAEGLSKKIDKPLSPAIKGTPGVIKALQELGKSKDEAEKLIKNIKAELANLSSKELFLKSCKMYPELLKKEKNIEKATELALLLLIRDSSGGHGNTIYYFQLDNNTIYMNLFDSPTANFININSYDNNEDLLWTGEIGVRENSVYAEEKGMALLYHILKGETK